MLLSEGQYPDQPGLRDQPEVPTKRQVEQISDVLPSDHHTAGDLGEWVQSPRIASTACININVSCR